MAMTRRSASIQTFNPEWPEPSALALNQARFTYDRPTDTLFVDFHAEARPGASVPLDRGDRNYLYVRIDPATNAVVGLQIEHVLSHALPRHPEIVDALAVATLVGIDRDELDRIVRVPANRDNAGLVTRLIEDFRRLSA